MGFRAAFRAFDGWSDQAPAFRKTRGRLQAGNSRLWAAQGFGRFGRPGRPQGLAQGLLVSPALSRFTSWRSLRHEPI